MSTFGKNITKNFTELQVYNLCEFIYTFTTKLKVFLRYALIGEVGLYMVILKMFFFFRYRGYHCLSKIVVQKNECHLMLNFKINLMWPIMNIRAVRNNRLFHIHGAVCS